MPISITNPQTLVIAFPDVCKTPSPPTGLVPIPYPNTATIANAKQATKQVATRQVFSTRSGSIRTGDSVRTSGYQVALDANATSHNSRKTSEAQMLRSSLSALTLQLQQLTSNDPAVWANVMGQIAVTASALYLTVTD